MDYQKFYQGQAFDAYTYFGAHPEKQGFVFRTYAPNAQQVSVIGEFTGWQEQSMEQRYQSGVWETHCDRAFPGQLYKFAIRGENGLQQHCDPYGFGMELRPGACSILRDLSSFSFSDEEWMKKRTRGYDRPINIYELHLGSWKRNGEEWLSYDEIAEPLIVYMKEHNYNFVEFLPLSEHPFDGSWGYQNTGFFAPTSRYGTARQLMELIDALHQAGIGAIMDFVPVHFAIDRYGLCEYDGSPLYEYPHKDVGESEWGSYNFIHSRGEVASFLQSAANYWLTEYHFDGLRMDAVSRLLYWQGDEKRGENGMAVNFLKIMNQGLHRLHPTAILIAEDSTAYPGVTKEVEDGGLGFDYKWDLGWMHDTLDYLSTHPYDRAAVPDKITFSMLYACNERYLLPFSHDEVVHGKKTILDKLNGSYEDKFSQGRLLYLYMFTHPGKKLNFMGNELGMFREWDETRVLDWNLVQFATHERFLHYMTELNLLYLESEPLWRRDYDCEGFQWIDCGTDDSRVFGYVRKGKHDALLILLNFSDQEVTISPAIGENCTLLLNTAWKEFGGSMKRRSEEGLPKTMLPYMGLLFTTGV